MDLLRAACQSLTFPFAVMNREGLFLFCNKAWTELHSGRLPAEGDHVTDAETEIHPLRLLAVECLESEADCKRELLYQVPGSPVLRFVVGKIEGQNDLVTVTIPFLHSSKEKSIVLPTGDAEGRTMPKSIRHAQSTSSLLPVPLEEVLNQIETPIYVKDVDGHYLYCNAYALAIHNRNRDEVIGSNSANLFPREIAGQLKEQDASILGSGKTETTHVNLNLDSLSLHFLLSKSPVYNQQGEAVAICGIAQDITLLQTSRMKLSASEMRYRAIFNNSFDGISIHEYDPVAQTTTLIDCNETFVRISGFSREDLMIIGDIRDAIEPVITDERLRQLVEQISTEGGFGGKYSWKRPDKRENVIEYTATGIQQGERQLLILNHRDVTERIGMEAALHANEQDQRALLSATDQAALLMDMDGYLITTNNACQNWLDADPTIRRTKSRSTRLYDFLPPDYASKFREQLLVVRENAIPVRFRHSLGKKLLEHTIYPILSPQGLIVRAALFVSNITKEHTMAKQLRKAQKMEAMGTLASGIAHEFNNILGIIGGFAEMAIEDTPKESHVRDCLHEIENARNRARDIVRQVLTFSKGDDKPLTSMELRPAIQSALQLLRASIPPTVEIFTHLPEGLPLVLANPTQIQQITINLCQNAADAMPQTKGSITIFLDHMEEDRQPAGSSISGESVLLRIRDDGSGISPANLDRIFDPFFTTKESGKGTGLGLAVVHGIVKSIGAEIQVESTPDIGTQFDIYIPVAPQAVETISEPECIPVHALPKGIETIMLIDDEASILKVVTRMLNSMGYTVSSHLHPQTAFQTFKGDPQNFDMIITDLSLPGENGIQLAANMKAIRPDIPILLSTGYSDVRTTDSEGNKLFAASLTKPYTRDELGSAIREVFDSLKPCQTDVESI